MAHKKFTKMLMEKGGEQFCQDWGEEKERGEGNQNLSIIVRGVPKAYTLCIVVTNKENS